MKPFTIIDAEQRSAEWFATRCGKLTGSRAADVFAKIKTGEAAARRDLRVQLVSERITGLTQDGNGFVSEDMRRGTELEPDAFAAYEAETGTMVSRAGFLLHNELPIGCSPDGVIGDYEGILELKVPRSATHLRYLRAGGLPAEHAAQVHHALFVTGAAFVDFCSFDPRFPPHLQVVIVRVSRESVDLAAYELAIRLFLGEVDAEYASVLALRAEGTMIVDDQLRPYFIVRT